ncbi:MAG: TetR/AcrR family transcriptional regulator [Hydrogenophilales bacterium]|nr:TetR/AcrR family transcriptional regulator [Hydrogenophilales bacterium]
MHPTVDTQQRILDSARELIYSRSYADVGVAAICEHAGVKKGSFYHFFPSKRDLTLAVLDAYYLEIKEHLVKKSFANDIPPLARLERFCQLAYAFQKQVLKDTGRVLGCPFGNLATELATQDEPIRIRIEQIFSNLQSSIRQVLREAIAAGEVQNIDDEATAQAMLAYFEGVMLLAKSHNDPEIIGQLLPALALIRITPR